jgi:hypothetical protein
MTTSDKIFLVFEEQQCAIKFTMLGTLINKNAATLTVKYWNGAAYSSLTITDGTLEPATDTLGKSGLVSWTAPSDEQKRQTFGVNGYVYELTVSATLSGTEGNNDTVIDLITGVPNQQTIRPFKFSTLFQNRLMLGGYTRGQEGNRMDYSLTYGAEVFNGDSSSRDGLQSLYFGGMDDLTGAVPIYNRFGSRIFSILLVLKNNEAYILDGASPLDFKIYPVSSKIGSPCPLTIDSAELGFEMSEGVARNVAIWVSYNGPMMFDGAVLKPIRGIDNYFDQTSGTAINFEAIHNCRGWVDTTWKEYNLLLPTGNNTDPNLWVCYDLVRKKWFEKAPGASTNYPLCGFRVADTDGAQYTYGGRADGYMLRLENGTTFDGTAMSQKVATGDFWPSQSIWHQTRIRWLKVVAKRVDEDATLEVYHYPDTNADFGQSVIFTNQDDDVSWAKEFDSGNGIDVIFAGAAETSLALSAAGKTERLARDTGPLNKLAWSHGFGFEISTSNTTKGFRPVYWGIRWEYARHDLGTEY